MTLAGLSLAYLKDRALTTALNILLLALGVASLVILLNFANQLQDRLARDADGIDLVVGAKGSPLQLILSAVYHLDAPTGNVPLGTVAMLRRDPTVRQAIPLALGDSFRGYRIVGTEPAYLALHGARIDRGRSWSAPREVVLGRAVATGTGADLGQRFAGSHGLGEGGQAHSERPFVVVGILQPTGSVIDRLILTSVESVWDVHGIAHGEDRADGDPHDHAGEDPEAGEDAPSGGTVAPEVTAVLVQYASPLAAVRLPGFINRQTQMQSAVPAVEISRLLSLVGVGLDAMRALALLLMATAGLSIFVALYTALRQRQGDMAMLRVIGAPKSGIFGQIILEGLILAGAGAALGLLLGHLVLAGAAAGFRQLQALGFDPWHVDPGELWIVAAALLIGAAAALIPAIQLFRADIADTLANSS